MDSSESISSSMDTTNDSVDVVGHFKKKHDTKSLDHIHHQRHHLGNYHYHNYNPSPSQYKSLLFKSRKRLHKRRQSILLNNNKLNTHEQGAISNKLPPDKECCAAKETPPSSSSATTITTSTSTTDNHLPSQQKPSHLNHNQQQQESASSFTSSINTYMSCCSTASEPELESQQQRGSTLDVYNESPGKKTVLFDKVTVYHFNRSQGFTSIPTEGGSTLGMKRKHFLRRRLSVDLYEEVRRRSRRQILLKIYFEKRKKEDEDLQRRTMASRSRSVNSSSSQANTPDSDDNSGEQGNISVRVSASCQIDDDVDKRVIDVDRVGRPNDDEDDEEETFSNVGDISDSELESDSNIFLQPLGVKLRRSLLRASGVFRIDPIEKKDCKKIRDSRERSGCKCVGQCIPQYCECSRLGVRCHVDRASFPCGCSSDGCRNPEGRTEFDFGRVRKHFEEKLLESHGQLSSNEEEELIATTPPSSTTSEESC